jgi:phage shock protein A
MKNTMTKEEAQAKFNEYLKARKNTAKYNNFVNESAGGYAEDAATKLVDEIREAGFAALYATGLVYSEDDFNAMREAWNTAVKSIDKKELSIPKIQEKSGVDHSVLSAIKKTFVTA